MSDVMRGHQPDDEPEQAVGFDADGLDEPGPAAPATDGTDSRRWTRVGIPVGAAALAAGAVVIAIQPGGDDTVRTAEAASTTAPPATIVPPTTARVEAVFSETTAAPSTACLLYTSDAADD